MIALVNNIVDTAQGKASLGQQRSGAWRKVRAEHLKAHPKCEVCGGISKLEVHHIVPFHTQPELELEPSNLITLCENRAYGNICHLWFGHLGDYSLINPKVASDVVTWRNKFKKARQVQKIIQS